MLSLIFYAETMKEKIILYRRFVFALSRKEQKADFEYNTFDTSAASKLKTDKYLQEEGS